MGVFASMVVGTTLANAQSGGTIVVTARKRAESLQDVPIAINAFSSRDIIEGGIAGLEDIATLSSGFTFFNQGGQQPISAVTRLAAR